MPIITQIEIRNFGGIRQLKVKVPPRGVVVKGGNHKGKTSFVGAVAAGLMAEGVDPGAIRQGADKSEIFIDLDAINEFRHVHRTIRSSGQEVVISNDQDDPRPRPAEYLKGIFGKSINPVSFYMAKADERRRLALEAMPCVVTAEDLKRWTGRDTWSDELLGQHGVLVVKRVHDDYYERRRLANKEAAERAEDARRARVEAEAIEASLPTRPGLTLEDATEKHERAHQAVMALEARAEAAKASERSQAEARARIAKLRADADAAATAAPAPPATVLQMHRDAVNASAGRIAALKAELTRVEESHAKLENELKAIEETQRAYSAAVVHASNLRMQAAEAEESLAAADAALAVSDADMEARRRERDEAAAALEHSKKLRALAEATKKQQGLEAAADEAQQAAGDLDRIVTRLAKDAPRELGARGGGIPGFDPAALTLDGKALDRLSGEEQLSFAVELAKRVNPKAKLLICDGIERVDEDLEARFLKLATADGWQLIATRVTRGELRIEAIEEG